MENTNNSINVILDKFEERYESETSDVRELSCRMQDVLNTNEAILNELDEKSFWKRFWKKISGHSYKLNQINSRNQFKLQQSNMLLIAAMTRQNKMVIEGLRLTLEKLHYIEKETRYIRNTVDKMEEIKKNRGKFWRPITNKVNSFRFWIYSKIKRND